MNLIRKGHGHAHRGVIGIESAIVLIAFVIVAAALAFVVLNMGFSTTQKAKTAIISAVEEAGSSMEIAGKITGTGDVEPSLLNATLIPIKIISGGGNVNLDGNLTSIKYLSNTIEYDNIYVGSLFNTTYINSTVAFEQAKGQWRSGDNSHRMITCGAAIDLATCNPVNGSAVNQTVALFYWTVNRNNNFILDMGEHVVLAIAFAENERPGSLDNLRAEIYIPVGAPLTIERIIPNITHKVVDMG